MTRYEGLYSPFAHLPLAAETLRVVDGVGTIYRWPLQPEPHVDLRGIVLPEWIVGATRNQENRKDLYFFMRVNSWKPSFPWLGRACSAFIAQFSIGCQQQLVLDVMVTDSGYDDVEEPRTHKYLRETIDYSKSLLKIDLDCNGRCGVISGHIAPLTVSTEYISQIFLVDMLKGKNALETSHPHIQYLMHVLWANRIMPITANGYPVLPELYSQGKI